MKKKRGFTLIETVATLSIIGVSFALSAGVIAALLNVQNKSNDQLYINKQLKQADSFIDDYVSFVSVHTNELSFSTPVVSVNKVKSGISGTNYTYTLEFSDNVLSINNTYTGSEEYFSKTGSINLEHIKSIVFSYDSTISLLTAEMWFSSSKLVYTYILR